MQTNENTKSVKFSLERVSTVHFVLVVMSVAVTYFWFLAAGFAGDSRVMLPWTLLAPVIGAGLAIPRRRWSALAVHGVVFALNLALPFLLLLV
ncbi:hypothetical protein ALI144C_33420 [Actinosynnema sp. ALI-1.44]|uniref:hypothetical protein n=1 Tax=Actinosynnema sp. ALI-1.44 TaxID=1933779 RepID=UPI00097C7841|nr:hypothetical protein [Actinosynnema sp. ALI-1.44]ONI77015.1 hypothetical protein ALI144C_33420 [Actinosynnema sp. ALI-1.44]